MSDTRQPQRRDTMHPRAGTALPEHEPLPARLREALRVVLASQRPLAIAWGPMWRLLPNEAFASFIGAPAPRPMAALPLRDTYPALARWLEPLLGRASDDEGSVVAEDELFCVYRNGYAEETYLTASCSRLLDDDGGSVLVSMDESTERVLAERRAATLRDVAAESLGSRCVTESCVRAIEALSRHQEEIPFALLYLRDGDGPARLTAAAHVTPDECASPAVIALATGTERPTWPVADALVRNETLAVDDVLDRFGALPAGDWPFAPRCAYVVPVTCPGDEAPGGALIAGVSARRAPDAQQRAFIELIAKQIGAVIAAGRLHEEASRRAVRLAEARRRAARRRARVRALEARFAAVLDERTRLAREIHDTLLQGVTAIALQLRAVLPHLEPSPASAEALDRIIAIAEQTSHEARQAVWDIRPGTRSNAEFTRALESVAWRLVDGTGIDARVTVSGRARRLSGEQQDVVLRVTQEAIANAVLHAAASAIRVRVAYGARQLTLSVVDDGAGFVIASDPQAYAGHWGLVGMRERALSVRGELVVRSAPGAGTTVRLVVPCASSQACAGASGSVGGPVSRRRGSHRAEARA
jgi:signal transduction histidine kinase